MSEPYTRVHYATKGRLYWLGLDLEHAIQRRDKWYPGLKIVKITTTTESEDLDV